MVPTGSDTAIDHCKQSSFRRSLCGTSARKSVGFRSTPEIQHLGQSLSAAAVSVHTVPASPSGSARPTSSSPQLLPSPAAFPLLPPRAASYTGRSAPGGAGSPQRSSPVPPLSPASTSMSSLAASSLGDSSSVLLPGQASAATTASVWLSTADKVCAAREAGLSDGGLYGMYIHKGRGFHGMPIFEKGVYSIYSDSRERWKVVRGTGMGRDVGVLASSGGAHNGSMPHEAASWERYEKGAWSDDKTVTASVFRGVDNNSGFIYIVGRTEGRHSCKECSARVAPGAWYRCNVCPDDNECDLCARCFHSGAHPLHPFTSMDFASFVPDHLLPTQGEGSSAGDIAKAIRQFANN